MGLYSTLPEDITEVDVIVAGGTSNLRCVTTTKLCYHH